LADADQEEPAVQVADTTCVSKVKLSDASLITRVIGEGVSVSGMLPLGAVERTLLEVWLMNCGEVRLADAHDMVALQLLPPTGMVQLDGVMEPLRTFRYTVCDATLPSTETQLNVQFWLE
jgi:hypothetical protein